MGEEGRGEDGQLEDLLLAGALVAGAQHGVLLGPVEPHEEAVVGQPEDVVNQQPTVRKTIEFVGDGLGSRKRSPPR